MDEQDKITKQYGDKPGRKKKLQPKKLKLEKEADAKTQRLITDARRPLLAEIDRQGKLLRKNRSEIQNLRNTVDRLRRKRGES